MAKFNKIMGTIPAESILWLTSGLKPFVEAP
jgi:hypothetical protein